jgi:antitoxin VapB
MYMALSIKDPAIDRLARELAQITGESITDAIKIALEERLARERARRASNSLGSTIRSIQDSVARLAVLDARPSQELLGYDDAGLPS